jgi:methylthioxylose transferase
MSVDQRTRPIRADLIAATAAVALFAVAAVAGGVLHGLGRPVFAGAPPLLAQWLPHVGPGTPLAVLAAVLLWWRGPELAARMSWRPLLALSYVSAVTWTLSLALIDGWRRGVADRLTTEHEYLHEVPGITDIPATLAGFTTRILDFQPDSWTTHVSAHPPGALLVFVWLDRAGLGGGAWAGLLCILVAGLVAVAVPQTVRLLSTGEAARAVVPFVVLFPGAVWSGVSADGLFAGVTATGVALLAHGVTTGRAVGAVAGGAVLAFGCYLSYGLVLMAAIALAVVVAAGPRWRTAGWTLLGAAPVVAAFTAAGFSWLTGYHLLIERYYQGIASDRAYGYWVWANLSLMTVCAGPAAAVILRRAVTAVRPRVRDATWVLPLAAAVAIVAADLSGYSKAEVERIWLPFAVWLTAGAALIPPADRRTWLAVQAVVALAVNHLVLTLW